jgi:peroxiredoxin
MNDTRRDSSRRRWLGGTLAAVSGVLAAPVVRAAAPVAGAGQAGASPMAPSVTAPGARRGRSAAARERMAGPMPEIGQPLELPPVTRLDGERYDAGASDRVLIVYWWASTCPFCAVQSPYMQAFWEAHAGRGLDMIALSIDETAEAARTYLSRKRFTFPAAWADDAFLDAFPKPKGLPITIVRGRDGRILQAEKGQLFPEDVEEMARWL